jgi:hypothetical protein
MRTITENGITYRIRGPYTARQLRELWPKILEKYPGTKLTFARWLVGYGKVYNRVQRKGP